MKPADRRRRVADEIKRLAAEILLREIHDYDMRMVTVLRCEVTGDMSEATIRYSVLGDEAKREECARHLTRVTGFIQRRIADQIKLYRTPRIKFVFDRSIDDGINLQRLFDQIDREREEND
ncbi:MAG TPA: 30S ribosome-binding factor RbfA [Acidobacteriota bacterium]|nr:30S ribosome-binding factor RbfA [Acidobacteriota bacterium]